jgi:hypothetical protein
MFGAVYCWNGILAELELANNLVWFWPGSVVGAAKLQVQAWRLALNFFSMPRHTSEQYNH